MRKPAEHWSHHRQVREEVADQVIQHYAEDMEKAQNIIVSQGYEIWARATWGIDQGDIASVESQQISEEQVQNSQASEGHEIWARASLGIHDRDLASVQRQQINEDSTWMPEADWY